jgi:hypothetical protein
MRASGNGALRNGRMLNNAMNVRDQSRNSLFPSFGPVSESPAYINGISPKTMCCGRMTKVPNWRFGQLYNGDCAFRAYSIGMKKQKKCIFGVNEIASPFVELCFFLGGFSITSVLVFSHFVFSL